jgi:hypothetical protein
MEADYAVSAHITGFTDQQGWKAPDLHPDRKKRADRSQPNSSDTANIQAICWSNGPAAPPTPNPLYNVPGEAHPSHQEPYHGPPSP